MPLDAFSVAPRGAYSDWRRLLTTYTGPLVRVRKTSGGDTTTEHDVPYVAATGRLDTADLAAFVGSESWAVVTRYDQAVGARPVTNATAAKQPVGGTAGTASKILTREAADFVVGSGQFLRRTDALGMSGATALTLYTEIKPRPITNFHYIVSFGTSAVASIAVGINNSATQIRVVTNDANRIFTVADMTAAATNKFLVVLGAGAQIGTVSLWQNGIACAELSSLNPTNTLNLADTSHGHGVHPNGSSLTLDGPQSEVFAWNSAFAGADLAAALAL